MLKRLDDQQWIDALLPGEGACAFAYLAQEGPSPVAAVGFDQVGETITLTRVRFIKTPDRNVLDGLLRAALDYGLQLGCTTYQIPSGSQADMEQALTDMGYHIGQPAGIASFFSSTRCGAQGL